MLLTAWLVAQSLAVPAGAVVGSQCVPQAGTGLVPSCLAESLSYCGGAQASPGFPGTAPCGKGAREVAFCGGQVKLNPPRFPSPLAAECVLPPDTRHKHIPSCRTSCQVLGFTVLTALNKFFLEITDLLGCCPSEGKASHN